MRRLWCDHCCGNQIVEELEFSVCCSKCGRVLEEDNFATHATFTKDAGGHSTFDGNFVSSIASDLGVSTERTLDKAHDEIRHIADTLGVSGGEKITKAAKNLYRMALEKNFTRGRRADQVAAACLYIVCRVENRPFLLIEFSDVLGVNVYVLGAVFLQLCRLLMLEEHPIIQKPVDPSLFIHRFANHLLGEKNDDVSRTALQILTRMKRDWMQTGRKPSGVCGAALYISALSHGFKFNKADVVKVVHICEATLTKRLIEFEGTESGGFTIEEFNDTAQELEQNFNSTVTKMSTDKGKTKSQTEFLCEHKDDIGEVHAHGLCEKCYREFLTISGGLDGGSDPPAFQRAARERSIAQIQSQTKTLEDDHEVAFEHEVVDGEIDKSGEANKLDDKSGEADKLEGSGGYESDRFSDIDDSEVDGYLHNEEEKKYKTIIWEEMNKEYLAEQAEKAKLAAGEEKPKKERKQKRKAEEMNNPKTAAEATQQVLMQKMAKKYSSKINCDKLREIFGEAELSEGTETNGAETVDFKDELETMDEYEEQNGYGDYQDPSYYDYDGEENIEKFDDGLF